MIFKEGAIERQRPTVANEAHIGQGLLDDNGLFFPLNNEDKIEVAITDFLNLPCALIATKAIGNSRHAGKVGGQAFG